MKALVLLCITAALAAPGTLAAGPQRTQVTLYGESLCPDCRNFTGVMHDLLFNQGFNEFVDFRYVAFGNAKNVTDNTTGEVTLRFQHGPEEQFLNGWINCAQALHPNQSVWMPYVACLEAGLNRSAADAGERVQNLETALECAEGQGLDAEALQACADGQQAKDLEAAAAAATWALQPPHAFVPWATVNGVPLGLSLQFMDRYLCVALGGPGPGCPPACGQVPAALLNTTCAWWYA